MVKTIQVEDETWQKLMIMKTEKMLESLDAVIVKLMKEAKAEKK